MYSEKFNLYFLKKEDATLHFYEPLGDGFYYSEVEVNISQNGNMIQVNGQKDHDYTLFVNRESKPKSIYGGDNWSYRENTGQAIIEKQGKNFSIQID